MTARRAWVAASGAVFVVALVGRACSSSNGEDRPATGGAAGQEGGEADSAGSGGLLSGGGGGGVAGTGGAAGSPDAGPCPWKSPPAGVPAGWEEMSAYSCDCRFYVPGINGAPPDPVTWEPCPQPAPNNPTCRRMATPWSAKFGVTVFPRFWFDKKAGKAFIQFGRTYYGNDENVRYRIVADLEGPVKNAFLEVGGQGCGLLDNGVGGGKYAFQVTGASMADPLPAKDVEGVLAGDIGAPYPSIVIKQKADPTLQTNWYVSSEWLVAAHGDVKARTWDADTWNLVYDPAQDPEKMPKHNVRPWSAAVFFEVGVGGYNGVMSWTLASGPKPLVRYYGDYTQAAGNFNTDGTDMVWTHGEGKAPGALEYPKLSVMTAPFTTNDEEVKAKAKRLRSDLWQLTPNPWGVGCGYAARKVFTPNTSGDGGWTNQLLIVRLSDGLSWLIAAPAPEQKMSFGEVLGVTCEDVFATAVFPDDPNTILRIRLDSLGPGIPPD